nr:unnamed protein product [Callosobruchus chinensis]
MKIPDKHIFERTTTPQSCESPTFSWYDSPTNQINFNKPVYMTENEHVFHNGFTGKQNQHFPHFTNGLEFTMTEEELQKHINEEFANLNIQSTDVNEVFKAFTVKNESHPVLNSTGTGPKFYKYFH